MSRDGTAEATHAARSHSPGAIMWAAPTLLGVALFFALPFVAVLVLSTVEWRFIDSPRWVGAEQLSTVLGSGQFWRAVVVTLQICALVVPAQLAAGLALAKLLTAPVRGVRVMSAVFLIPWTMAPIVVGVIARWVFSPSDGFIAGLVGRRVDWIVDPAIAPFAVAAVVIWQATGLTALLYAGALGTVPDEVRDAAALDGAGPWRTLLAVELPLLSRTTLFLSVAAVAQAFGIYDIVVTLTGGGPGTSTTTLSFLIVQTAWQQFDIGAAAAMAVVTTAILGAVVGALFWSLGKPPS